MIERRSGSVRAFLVGMLARVSAQLLNAMGELACLAIGSLGAYWFWDRGLSIVLGA